MLPGSPVHRAVGHSLFVPGRPSQNPRARRAEKHLTQRFSTELQEYLRQLVLLFVTHFLTHACALAHPYTRLMLTEPVVNLSV